MRPVWRGKPNYGQERFLRCRLPADPSNRNVHTHIIRIALERRNLLTVMINVLMADIIEISSRLPLIKTLITRVSRHGVEALGHSAPGTPVSVRNSAYVPIA